MPRQSYINEASGNAANPFPFLIHRTGQVSKVYCHDHDFWELVYIHSGRGTCINAGESFEFHSHQLILTPPLVAHEFLSHSKTRHEQISLTIYPRFLEQAAVARVQVWELLTRIEESGCFTITVPEMDIRHIENSLEVISHEFLFQRADFESVISLEIARLLISVNRFLVDERGAFPQLSDLPYVIYEAIKQIELRYHEIGNLAELLHHVRVAVNPRYFIRLFKKHVGFTPIQYLNRVRIEKCCSLLLHTPQPIAHAALDAGFGDLRFFNRQFRRFTGLTPREFREFAKEDPALISQANRFKLLGR